MLWRGKLSRGMSTSYVTVTLSTDYKRISTALENLTTRNNILNWWQWWGARKFHIVPTFRGFNISGLNLAETGHSMLKVK